MQSKSLLSDRVVELIAEQLAVEPSRLAVSNVSGDASTRAYFRAQAGERSVIVALYQEPFDEGESALQRLTRLELTSPTSRLSFANDPCAHIESTRLLLEAGLPVPLLLASRGDERAMLFEDVGDRRLQDRLSELTPSQARDTYLEALRLIVRIQDATPLAIESGSICSLLAFDEMKLRWELGHFFANYFNRYLGLRLDAPVSNAVQIEFKSLSAELAARPRVLTHRDYHARNLMVHGGGLVIIDHQDARMGPVTYDLASLLYDPYVELPGELVSELIETFIELKGESSQPLLEPESFRRELQMMTVQRMLKAIGTYTYQAVVVGNRVYVRYIAKALERALQALDALGELTATRELLESTRPSE